MKKVINKNKVFYFSVIVMAVSLIVLTSVKVVFDFFVSDEREVKTKVNLATLDAYGYTLDDMDTELYKTYFNELKDILSKDEIDMESYAKTLMKLFVTDFYTLDNKITSSDVGGEEFVHADFVVNFKLNASDTMYNHVKNNVYGDREQVLPIVSDVSVNDISSEQYNYNGNSYDAFKVNVSWEYESDLGYDSSGIFYVIKDQNKLNVVQKVGE